MWKTVSLKKTWTALGDYHPQLERILFGASMIGLLVVAHLQIQKSRGFEGGCSGVGLGTGGTASGSAGTEGLFDCAAITSGMGSELLGVSNIAWGFAFYVIVAILTSGMLSGGTKVRRWLRGTRLVLIGGGAVYTTYLTMLQLGFLDGVCLPCLGSAVAVGGLCGSEWAMLSKEGGAMASSETWERQASVFARGVAIVLLLSGANMTFSWGTPFEAGKAGEAEARAGTPRANCKLEDKTPVANEGRGLVRDGDITVGDEEGAVVVIEYFDPNCPHCRRFHEVMKGVVRGYREEVQFVFKPFPLGKESLPEIGALYVADQKGRFEEMLDAQYERQKENGEITVQAIQKISQEIGLDGTSVLREVSKAGYRTRAVKTAQRGKDVGVDRVPTVLVNGHFVGTRRGECLASFIEAAKQGELGRDEEYRSE